jgi:SAM-dependent methyltransferase
VTVTSQDGYDKMADIYDVFSSAETADFHLDCASGTKEILDIGAGTGRVAIPIAENGTRVVCVEPSTAMLREFKKKLDSRPELKQMITVVHADAASFTLDRTLPAAFMSGSFDHLLTDDERLRALKNIADHLEPGARLVLDVWLGLMTDDPATWAGEATLGDTTYKRAVGRKVLPDGTVELEIVITVERDGKVVDRIEQHSTAGVSSRELVHRLLTETGFRVRHEFGSYDRTPYRDGDSVLIIEAVKM